MDLGQLISLGFATAQDFWSWLLMLLAAWAAGKGWPALEAWLLDDARFGPPIRAWRPHFAVPRPAKWLATPTMSTSAVLLLSPCTWPPRWPCLRR